MNFADCINIKPVELEAILARSVPFSLAQCETIDDLGYELAIQARPNELGFGFGDKFWDAFKREFRAFLCEADPKYRDLRKQMKSASSQGTTAAVAVISSAFGATMGLSATVVSPMVALLVLAVLRLGKESFCASIALEQPLRSKS